MKEKKLVITLDPSKSRGTAADDVQTVQELIHNMDWRLVKAQKRILNNLMAKTEDPAENAVLEGVLALYDAIQDKAVDVYKYSEDEVFSLSESKGWITDEEAREIVLKEQKS